jgi:ankyrin repeat protein
MQGGDSGYEWKDFLCSANNYFRDTIRVKHNGLSEITMEPVDLLCHAIDADDLETARQLLTSGVDLNVPCFEIQGAPVLYLAILKGNLTMVQLLLNHGADPNFYPDEPAASIYCSNACL